MIISTYWRQQGISDAQEGYPPKTEAFFKASQIIRFYDCYIKAYRYTKKNR